MNLDIVDVKDKSWIKKRESLWKSNWSQDMSRMTGEDKRLTEVAKKVFMGEIISPLDNALKVYSAEYIPSLFALFNPYQCSENWDWLIKEGWNQPASSTMKGKITYAFQQFSDQILLDDRFRKYGWTENLRSEFFDYYYGDIYIPNTLTILGVEVPQNLKPEILCARMGGALSGLFLGKYDADYLFLNKFGYLAQSVEHIDINVFSPESVPNRRIDSDMKLSWADLFLVCRDWEAAFNKHKKAGMQAPKWESMKYEQFITQPEIVEFKNQMDMLFEPASLHCGLYNLKMWSNHQHASIRELRRSTLGKIPFTHPESLSSNKMNSSGHGLTKTADQDKVVINSQMEKYFLSEVNRIIKIGKNANLENIESEFPSIEQYFQFIRKFDISYSPEEMHENILYFYDLKDESLEARDELLLSHIYQNRIVNIVLDPFGEGKPSYINQFYRGCWKQLIKLVSNEPEKYRIKTRKSGSDWNYELKVEISCFGREYNYTYTVDSDWCDNQIFSDMQSFVEKERFPQRLFVHSTDNSALIGYFPESFAEIFDTFKS